MQEDRAGFSIGLKCGEGPVGQNQHGVAGLDLAEAMAAGHAAGRGPVFRRVAVGVEGTGAQGLCVGGGNGGKADGHDSLLSRAQ